MAKVKPTPSAPTSGTTVGGLRWTISSDAAPTVIIAKPVNNERSKSQTYQQMNQLIVQLDQLFEGLPP